MGWREMLRGLRRGGGEAVPVPVILFTRAGCHLCVEVAEMLRAAAGKIPLAVETIDVDGDAQLVVLYGDKVPVVRIAGKDRFFGPINPVLLRRTLGAELRHLREIREDDARPTQSGLGGSAQV